VFVPVLRRSWIEIDVERDLRARLVAAESPTGETTWLERLAMRRGQPMPATPEVVATLPGGAGWPLRSLDLSRRHRHERVRARAALAVSAAGLLSLASALTLPLQGRLRGLLEVFPLYVPQTAAASVSFLSIGLLLLARGLRRGHRLAWGLACGLLALTAVLDLLKGFDVEEAIICALIAIWLLRQRAAFPVQPDNRQLRWPLWVLLSGGLVAGVSTVLVLLTGQHQDKDLSARAIAERLLGDSQLPLPSTAPLVTPALLATGFAVLLACGLLLTSTRRRPPLTPAQRRADLRRARKIVAEHGGDTLAYFTLRDDKTWFFTGDCVVAYAVRDGVCLVAPDPVGPPEQWATAWADFTEFADRHGWPVTVIGAGAGWLPIYQAAGLRPMYMGDEAIVDCQAFTLHGRPMKGLRSAYHRVQRAGFEVRFFDPATLEPDLAADLRDMLTKSRRGQVERGFSMTLSRVFDPADTGLLLSVAFGPDGRAAGFCQWTPASDISGWSLDLMRRDASAALPNGLIDFLIIETIAHAKSRGQWGLSLNFAVMRAVLAGEQGGGILTDLQRRILNRFSDTMQIASLWHFNEKYKPYWRPRYLALGRLTSAPAQSLAIADAEGVTELPVIGRFLGQNAEQTTMDEPTSDGERELVPGRPGR
jgi:lysyl-tRNA synthetase class 2